LRRTGSLLSCSGDLIGQILPGSVKLGLHSMNDVGHTFDLTALRGDGCLIIPVDDLMEQACISLDRSHSLIEPGLEGHD
jgi:hypothetical protein